MRKKLKESLAMDSERIQCQINNIHFLWPKNYMGLYFINNNQAWVLTWIMTLDNKASNLGK